MSSSPPYRILPEITEANEHFWRGGEDGELRFLRCGECRLFIHPPAPVCPKCRARDPKPAAVSGRATVVSYTVNHQKWIPGDEVPYCIALVEIAEQEGLRLTTNLVGCAPEAVRIGMKVKVRFEKRDDVYLPLFEPEDA